MAVDYSRRARMLFLAAGACLLAVVVLALLAWATVALQSADQCAQTTCQDIWLLPLFLSPWLILAALVMGVVALAVQARARRERATRSFAEGETTPYRLQLASPGLRLVAALLDGLVGVVVWGLVAAVISATLAVVTGHQGSAYGWDAWAETVAGLAAAIFLQAQLWKSRGQSPGMMVFGFKVVDRATGQRPSLNRALLRAGAWTVSLLGTFVVVGAIGWLWSFWDPQRQGLHDKLAGTIVTTI